jgi:hypothetical protein
MDVFDRLRAAGYRPPYGVEEARVLDEWHRALKSYSAESVHSGITQLIATRQKTEWPTVAVALDHVVAVHRGQQAAPEDAFQVVDPVDAEWFAHWLEDTRRRVLKSIPEVK